MYFYGAVLVSLMFCFLLIGIPILIGVIVWYKFSSVTVGDNSVVFKKGWLNTTQKQIPYDKINAVDVSIDLFGKYMGYGTVRILTGNDIEGIRFQGIDRPNELKQQIEAHLSQSRPGQKAASSYANAPQHSVADELTKLSELKKQGIITQDEFDKKKAQLLG